MGRYKKFSPLGQSNFNTADAEKILLDRYEETYKFEPQSVEIPTYDIIDDKLKGKVQNMVKLMQDDDKGGKECDWWTAIIGSEGTGKTTLATGYLLEFCKAVGINFIELLKTNVVFDEFEVIRMISKMDIDAKFNYIWADEGANVFFNRDSSTTARRWSVRFSNAIRDTRPFVVICSVEQKQLDTIIRNHRVKSLIRIQEHGIYHYYNYNRMIELLRKNKGLRDQEFKWSSVEPEFVGTFRRSPEMKKLADMLKRNYRARMKMEAQQDYNIMLKKKLFKMESTKSTNKYKWNQP
jgi:hypothetical protein